MGFSDRAYTINGTSYWCAPWEVDGIERQDETDFALQVQMRKSWLAVSTVEPLSAQPALTYQSSPNTKYKW
jgi:hypothetical protein